MDNLTKEQRKKNMQNIRSRDTLAEKKLMKALRSNGLYFSRYVSTLPGKPDIVFRRKKVAVFVDSDFWHGHPKRCVMPKSNCDYWNNKIEGNRRRDKQVNKELKRQGWKVIRFWEYDIKKNPERCVKRITVEQ